MPRFQQIATSATPSGTLGPSGRRLAVRRREAALNLLDFWRGLALLSLLLLAALVLALGAAGCASKPRGDREFIPGSGWEPVN